MSDASATEKYTSILIFGHSGVKDQNDKLVYSKQGFEHEIEHESDLGSTLNAENAITPGNDRKIGYWYTVAKEAVN